ncbi:MAG: hypothetical protein WCK43_00560 [bacterium]
MGNFTKVLVMFLVSTSSLCFAEAIQGHIKDEGVFNPWPREQKTKEAKNFNETEFQKTFPRSKKPINVDYAELSEDRKHVRVPGGNGEFSLSLYKDLFLKYNINDLQWRNGTIVSKKGAEPIKKN